MHKSRALIQSSALVYWIINYIFRHYFKYLIRHIPTVYHHSLKHSISMQLDDVFKQQQQPSDERGALGHWLVARMTKVPDERWEDFQEAVQALMRKFTKPEMPPPPTPTPQPQQPPMGMPMAMPQSPRTNWPQTHPSPLMWSQQQPLQQQQQWGWPESIPTQPYQPPHHQATHPQPPRSHSTPNMHLQGQVNIPVSVHTLYLIFIQTSN